MANLQDLRNEIDGIDAQLLALYEQRMDVAQRIGKLKMAEGRAVYDPDREAQVLVEKRARVQNPAYADGAEALFRTLMAASRNLQDTITGGEK